VGSGRSRLISGGVMQYVADGGRRTWPGSSKLVLCPIERYELSRGLAEYLVLLIISEACKNKGIRFLDLLLLEASKVDRVAAALSV
jgi:hypothetical protein